MLVVALGRGGLDASLGLKERLKVLQRATTAVVLTIGGARLQDRNRNKGSERESYVCEREERKKGAK